MKNKVISYIMAVAFIILSFGYVIDMTCFNGAFYEYEYTKNNTAISIGLSEEDLNKATSILLGYIVGDVDSLDVVVSVSGEEVLMFNEREVAHMVDVRNLYTVVNYLKIASLFIFFIGLFYLFLSKTEYLFSLIKSSYQRVVMITIGIISFLVLIALTNFNFFWNTFHRLIFSNDLWLLNPNTDRLIMMVPESFFFDLVIMIIGIFVFILVIYYIALHRLSKKELKI